MNKFLTIFAIIASLLVSANLFSQNTAESKDTVKFANVDETPMFQGGDLNKFSLWVFSQIKYPEEAYKNKIMGRVLVQFVVSKEGKVKDVKVVRSSGSELLDNEAVRAISISPDWTPGKVKGEPVHVSYMFPVVFKYNPDDPKTSEENGSEPIPFDDVEVKPTFQGKDPNAEFSKWMAGEMKYPEEASKNKIMGRVLIQFVISRDGKVKDVKVARSSGSDLLDKEAVRVISASPDWDPGKMEGKPVDVRYLFPVVFIIR